MLRFKAVIWSLVLLQCPFLGTLRAQTYWQQEVNYLIQVSLDDSAKALHGHITMHYTNHSPNSLPFIYFQLMPNAYLGKQSALNNQLLAHDEHSLQFANAVYKGSMDSLHWEVDGVDAKSFACKDTADIEILVLPEPLLPGQSVRLETSFYVKLPSSHLSRMGYKDHAYYFSQWYPKPAVYDAYGWHPLSYLDKGEFFGELGNYEVQITLPQNFVVAATGQLTSADELKNLDTLAQFSKTYAHPKKRKFLKKAITPSPKRKTLTYQINNVHDFAFCADPEFLLMQDSTTINGKNIQLQSFVKMSHLSGWTQANRYMQEALEFYSEEVGTYPYSICTLADVDDITGGDMEYPTLAFINHSYSIEEAIVHEVGHQWFYSAIASNERDEPWMDEGINTFYETKFFSEKYPETHIHYYAYMLDGMNFPYYQQSHSEYYALARLQKDVPTKTPSHLLSPDNYFTLAYSKPTAALWYLYKICGADSFKTIMHQYFDSQKFKHPVNGDLHEIFKQHIGDKADWFFDDAMISNGKINYSIKNVQKKEDELIIEIHNLGEMEAPLYIETFSADEKKTGSYPFDPIANKANVNIPYSSSIEWIAIDHEMSIPDVELANNYLRIADGHKKAKPTRFNFFSSFENPYRKHIYYLPGAAGNLYDGIQMGMMLHNYGFLPKKTEWFVLPMFAVKTLRPAFLGALTHTHYFKKNNPDRLVFHTAANVQSYNIASGTPLWSFQLSPSIKFIFERRDIYSPLTHEAGLKNQLVVTQVDPDLLLDNRWKFLLQNVAYYKLNYKKRLWAVENTVSLESVYDFGINYAFAPLTTITPAVKLFNELKVTYTYFKGKSAIQLRVFAGTFLTDPSMVTDTRFRLSGWRGVWDYAFNDYYLGRSESYGFFNQQVAHQDGDFKVNTFVGQTNKWIITANLEWDIPLIYAGVYMDIGTYSGAGSFVGSQAFVYNGGFYLRTPDRILQIYFPMIASTDITQSVGLNTSSYWERIRFTVQLQNIQLIKTIRKLFI